MCDCEVCLKIRLMQDFANKCDNPKDRERVQSVMEEWMNAGEDADWYKAKYIELRKQTDNKR